MLIDVRIEPAVVKFAKNAPKKAPGHTRRPKIRKAAKAIPVGAHKDVALGWTNANRSPSLAVPKYTTARPATMSKFSSFLSIARLNLSVHSLSKCSGHQFSHSRPVSINGTRNQLDQAGGAADRPDRRGFGIRSAPFLAGG